tara:strand:- start:976 stop:1950 length:975 start_codon:yes stop_codon:yes gene_type:complete
VKKTYFISGGTGSFGKKFINYLENNNLAKKIIIFSRDEHKQIELEKKIPNNKKKLFRFFIGDIRDKERLNWAISDDVDVVIHAAALKQLPATEYNPFETVLTNIIGTQNLIETIIKKKIKRSMLVSTDKAVSPINLYGATKLTAEKLFITANIFKGKARSMFSVARYGNVMGSRGSVIPVFLKQNKDQNYFTITNKDMTRFTISLNDAVKFVHERIENMSGGEIFIPKLESYKITDLAKSINPNKKIKLIGIRNGEKLHEELINSSELNNTIEKKNYYTILPLKKMKIKISQPSGSYNSYNGGKFISIKSLSKTIRLNLKDFEK